MAHALKSFLNFYMRSHKENIILYMFVVGGGTGTEKKVFIVGVVQELKRKVSE